MNNDEPEDPDEVTADQIRRANEMGRGGGLMSRRREQQSGQPLAATRQQLAPPR